MATSALGTGTPRACCRARGASTSSGPTLIRAAHSTVCLRRGPGDARTDAPSSKRSGGRRASIKGLPAVYTPPQTKSGGSKTARDFHIAPLWADQDKRQMTVLFSSRPVGGARGAAGEDEAPGSRSSGGGGGGGSGAPERWFRWFDLDENPFVERRVGAEGGAEGEASSTDSSGEGEANKRGWRSAKSRARFVAYRSERQHTPETRSRMSAARKGLRKGAETREKMRQKKKATTRSTAVREKIAASMRGRRVSDATRAKMAEAARRRKTQTMGKIVADIISGLPRQAEEGADELVVDGRALSKWSLGELRSLALVWGLPRGSSAKVTKEDLVAFCEHAAMLDSPEMVPRAELATAAPHKFEGAEYRTWKVDALRARLEELGVAVPSTYVSKQVLFLALTRPETRASLVGATKEPAAEKEEEEAAAAALADSASQEQAAPPPVRDMNMREYTVLARRWRRWREHFRSVHAREVEKEDLRALAEHNPPLYRTFRRYFELRDAYRETDDEDF